MRGPGRAAGAPTVDARLPPCNPITGPGPWNVAFSMSARADCRCCRQPAPTAAAIARTRAGMERRGGAGAISEFEPVSYSYSQFYLVFALASMYIAMLMTGWGSVVEKVRPRPRGAAAPWGACLPGRLCACWRCARLAPAHGLLKQEGGGTLPGVPGARPEHECCAVRCPG